VIASETSGSYKKFLLALVGSSNHWLSCMDVYCENTVIYTNVCIRSMYKVVYGDVGVFWCKDTFRGDVAIYVESLLFTVVTLIRITAIVSRHLDTCISFSMLLNFIHSFIHLDFVRSYRAWFLKHKDGEDCSVCGSKAQQRTVC
jgi:hypothetical protein